MTISDCHLEGNGLLLTIEKLDSLNEWNLTRARTGQDIDLNTIKAAEHLGNPVVLATSLIPQLVCHVLRGDLGGGSALAARIDQLLGGHIDVLSWEFGWTFLNTQGLCRAFMLDYAASEPLFHRACGVAEAAGQPGYTCRTLINLGRDYHRQGRIAESIEVLTELEYSRDLSTAGLMYARSHLAEMFEHHGHWEQARQQLATVCKPDSGLGARELCYFGSAYGRALTHLGLDSEAEESFRRARQAADTVGWAHNIAVVDASLATLRLRQGRVENARLHAEAAIAVFVEGQSAYEEMCANLVLARICVHEGQGDQAIAILQDPRASKMGGAFRHQVEQMLVEVHKSSGAWEHVVVHQQRALAHNAEARQDLGSLYTLLTKYQQGPGLREQGRRLAQTNQTLKAVHHERSELLNIIAHDLRSPLTALGLTLEAMRNVHDTGTRKARLATAQDTVDRIQALAAQLSTLSEWEHGAVNFDLDDVPMLPLVGTAIRELRSTADRKGIRFLVESESGAQLSAFADRARVEQVLQNLLSNALKYSGRGSTVTIEISVDPHHPGTVRIAVNDQGQGLSQQDLCGLFGKYTRLSSTPSANESSSGNGLYIARSFARAMGGDIMAHSFGKGKGSTFALTLPLLDTPKPAMSESQGGRPPSLDVGDGHVT